LYRTSAKFRADKAANPEDKYIYQCPYSGEAAHGFTTLAHLERHLKDDLKNPKKEGTPHHEAMVEDGWSDPDFYGVPSASSIAQKTKKNLKKLQDAGITFKLPKRAEPTQVPGRNVWTGDHHGGEPLMPARLEKYVARGNSDRFESLYELYDGKIPAHRRGRIVLGSTPDQFPIPSTLSRPGIWRGNERPLPGVKIPGDDVDMEDVDED